MNKPEKSEKKKAHDYSAPIKAWHASLSPEQKAEFRRKVSEGMLRYHAKLTPLQKERIAKRMSEKKKAFYKTYAGHVEREYRRYLSKNYQENLSKERKKKTREKQAKWQREKWKNYTPEEREKNKEAIRRGRRKKMKDLFEYNVPRKKNYCGVVHEDSLHG